MRTATAKLCGTALAVLLTTGTLARADQIHWNYSWSNSPSQIMADSPGTSKITLSNQGLTEVVGNSYIVSTNLQTVSSASDDKPDTFTNKTYALTLNLTDEASNTSGSLTFTGALSGTLSAHSSLITNQFNAPTTQTLVLGNYQYTVSFPTYTPPGPPGSTNAGSISVLVSVELFNSLPEPSSLLLAGFGIVLIGLFQGRNHWRRFPLLPA